MRQVKKTELQIGNIIALEIKLYGREAFEVMDVCSGKDYIIVKSRNSHKEKRLMVNQNSSVLLLHETPPEK